jgi:hypothetical protein
VTTQPQGTSNNNPYGVSLFTVRTPSGSELNLQTQEEADWYESRHDRYIADNHFPNVSDLQDLDRLLMLEVLSYRWGFWMAQGFDYMYTRVDEGALKNSIKEYSVEIRLLKASLGIDKSTRDKDKGESLSDYTDHLLERAKVFGYHRNEQYATAVTKMYQLRSMITTYDRCNDEERRMLDLSPDSIFDWIRQEVIKPWDEMSDAFRKSQSMWIRQM